MENPGLRRLDSRHKKNAGLRPRPTKGCSSGLCLLAALAFPLARGFPSGGKNSVLYPNAATFSPLQFLFAMRVPLFLVGLLSMHLLFAPGCATSRDSLPAIQEQNQSKAEVLTLFRSRATPEELRQWETLRASHDPAERDRALALVLFKLKRLELRKIGIYAGTVRSPTGEEIESTDCGWQVALFPMNSPEEQLITAVMSRENIFWGGVGNMGGFTMSVSKQQFFKARKALLPFTYPKMRICLLGIPNFILD